MAFTVDRQHEKDVFASYVANCDASDSKVYLKIMIEIIPSLEKAGAFCSAGPVSLSQILFVGRSIYFLILTLTVFVTYFVASQFFVALIRTLYLSV